MQLFKSGKSDQGNRSIFEERLRFQIQQDTSEWRQLKKRFESRRIQRHLKNVALVCISKLNKSDLPHFKFDPETSEDNYPVMLINTESTIASIMQLIRQEIDLTSKTGLSVMQGGKLLIPGLKLSELQLEYGEIVFLNYTQSQSFG